MDIIVVSVDEVQEVAISNGHGHAICPWSDEDFEECGSFEINRKDINRDSSWNNAIIDILEDENDNKLIVVRYDEQTKY